MRRRTAARRRSGSRATSGSCRRIVRRHHELLVGRARPTSATCSKPDVSAPGLDVLSSTPPLTTGSTFSVFAGTSMATPHVAGAAALLLQQHPGWSSWQVKSALMSTAGAAWGDTARTQEAPVLLEGAGLANLSRRERSEGVHRPAVALVPADRRLDRRAAPSTLLTLATPATAPGIGRCASPLSRRRPASRSTCRAQLRSSPGGDVAIPVVVRVAANATAGRELRLRRPDRRTASSGACPTAFLVERPALRNVPAVKLQEAADRQTPQRGRNGSASTAAHSAPFGPPPSYTGVPMNEDGSEHLYYTDINEPIVNFGVSVLAAARAR